MAILCGKLNLIHQNGNVRSPDAKCCSLFMCVVYRNLQSWPRVTNRTVPKSEIFVENMDVVEMLETLSTLSSNRNTLVSGMGVT